MRSTHDPRPRLARTLLAACLLGGAPGCGWKLDPGPAPLVEAQRVAVLTVAGDGRAAELVVAVRAGSAYDPVGREGLAWQVAHAIVPSGEDGLGETEGAEAWAPLGALPSVEVGPEIVRFRVEVPPERAVEAAALLARQVGAASAGPRALEAARLAAAQAAAPERQAPLELAGHLLRWMVYEGHPYGHAPTGSAQGALRITALDVQQFVDRRYLRAVIAAGVGGLAEGAPEVALAADGLRAGLEQRPPRLSRDVTPRLPPTRAARTALITGPTGADQDAITLGQSLDLSLQHADGAAVLVAAEALSARLDGALGGQARLSAGLVEPFASVQAQLQISILGPPDDLRPFLARALREIELFAQDGVRADELERAKRAALDLARRPDGLLGRASAAALLDAPDPRLALPERVEALTPALVNAAIARWIHPDQLAIAVAARDPEGMRAAFSEVSGASSVQPDGYDLNVKSLTVVSYEELHR